MKSLTRILLLLIIILGIVISSSATQSRDDIQQDSKNDSSDFDPLSLLNDPYDHSTANSSPALIQKTAMSNINQKKCL